VKNISPAEFKQILKIDKESFDYYYDRAKMSAAFDYYDHIFVRSKNKIVSFLLYKVEKEKVFIRRIAVAAALRQKGYGKKMVEKIVTIAQKSKKKKVYAFSRVSNIKGVKFFKSLNFEIKNKIEKYYLPNDETAYILERPV